AADAIARALDRELDTVRRDFLPIGPTGRLLAAVERRVDLDRGHRPSRIFALFRLGQLVGVEHPAPRREIPAADADADRPFAHRDSLSRVAPWTFATSSS